MLAWLKLVDHPVFYLQETFYFCQRLYAYAINFPFNIQRTTNSAGPAPAWLTASLKCHI